MKRLRHAIAAAIQAMAATWTIHRLRARVRREWMDRARMIVGDPDRVVLPRTLLESPALVALTSRALPPPPSRDRRRLLQGVLLALVVAAAATMLAFTIAAVVRARRRSRARAAAASTAQPVVIPVAAAGPGDGGPDAVPAIDLPESAGDRLEA